MKNKIDIKFKKQEQSRVAPGQKKKNVLLSPGVFGVKIKWCKSKCGII